MKNQEDKLKELLVSYLKNNNKDHYHLFLKDVDLYVKKVLFKKVSNLELLEDTAQDIIIGIHKSLQRFDMKQSILPWINSIIFHKTIDFYRKQSRFKNLESLENHDLEKNEISVEDQMVYKEVLKYLSKEVFGEVYLEQKLMGCSVEEIAEKLGISQSNTKVTFHRLTKKIREDFS